MIRDETESLLKKGVYFALLKKGVYFAFDMGFMVFEAAFDRVVLPKD